MPCRNDNQDDNCDHQGLQHELEQANLFLVVTKEARTKGINTRAGGPVHQNPDGGEAIETGLAA
jgi:hypothetical protein